MLGIGVTGEATYDAGIAGPLDRLEERASGFHVLEPAIGRGHYLLIAAREGEEPASKPQ